MKADALNTEFVDAWSKAHSSEAAAWVASRPGTPGPQAADLAVPYFVAYSAAHPGTFPGVVEFQSADGKAGKRVEPLSRVGDISSLFFEMWRDDNPQVDLEPVPADMVMDSGSGLDPHITLSNARYQLDRVADQWARNSGREPATVRAEIEAMLAERAESPLAGVVGVELINVLDFNFALRSRYGE